MNIFNSINDFKTEKKTVLTLGTFDGVHLGHKKILDKVIQNCKKGEYESVVLTFFPHPRMILQHSSELKLLNTLDEKIDLLSNIGVQNLIIHPFDTVFARLTAEDFVKEILVEKIKIHKIIIGYDHRFGRNRTADYNDLVNFGKQYNFEVEQIGVEEIDEMAVSSTKIRNAILKGNISLARNYLGYDYCFTGKVITGKKLGRSIGFPTANLEIIDKYKLIPENGVYVVKSNIEGKIVFGMMNIGLNPTVNGQIKSIEVHYFDFDSDLYSKEITVSLLQKIRLEQKFQSLEDLKTQLKKDKEQSLRFVITN